MDLYKSTDKGVILPTTEIAKLNLSQALRGYFSFEDLKKVWDREDAVGLRIYNTLDTVEPTRHRLIAAGVKADGFELEDRYLLSHMADDDKFSLFAITLPDRKAALAAAESGNSGFKDDFRKFASYFSKSMMDELSKDTNASGVSFYELRLDPFKNLPSHINQARNILSSHIAITTSIDQGRVSEVDINASFRNMLCDRPCPGHCLAIDKQKGTTSRSIFTADTNLSESPYLIKWQ